MELDRNGLEVLERAECLRLLSQRTLGRVAFTSGALPYVLPINFRLLHEAIIVRTRLGGRLDGALRDTVVAFEVDDVDEGAHVGWSVAVTGVATRVLDPCDVDGGEAQAAGWWSPSDHESVITISTELLTGRRLTVGSGPISR